MGNNKLTAAQKNAWNVISKCELNEFTASDLVLDDGKKISGNTLSSLAKKGILNKLTESSPFKYTINEDALAEFGLVLKRGLKPMREENISLRERTETLEKLSEIDMPDELKNKIINLINKKQGISFDEYKEEVEFAINDDGGICILEPKEKLIANEKFDNNFLIEGDNLVSLNILRETHKNKIDCIYIDSPYNTFNKEFVYNDKMIGAEDGYRHSKWLSFMKKRLELARETLTDDGVIFMSIDDNEQANLKLLCDDIFGEKNFVNIFHWVSNLKGRQLDGSGAAGTTEYILCYAKDKQNTSNFTGNREHLKQLMPELYKADYNILSDEFGQYVLKNQLYNTNSKFNEETRPNLVYNIYYNPNTEDIITTPVDEIYENKDYVKIAPHKNSDGTHKYHAFRWSKEKIQTDKQDLYFCQSKNGDWQVWTKIRDVYTTLLKDLIMGIGNGGDDLKKVGLNKLFDYPKPVSLIKLLINVLAKKDAIVLDFFAGSGTTGQAVLELNQEDGGNRKFILCTNNENNICESVTYPRLKTVLTGIKPDGTDYSNGIDANLIYYKNDIMTNDNFNDNKYDTDKELKLMLENMNNNIAILHNDTEVTDFINDIDTIDINKVYLKDGVLFSSTEKNILQNKEIQIEYID